MTLINPDLFILLFLCSPVLFGFIFLVFFKSLYKWSFFLSFFLASLLLLISIYCWATCWSYDSFGLLSDSISRNMILWTSLFVWLLVIYAKSFFSNKQESHKFYALSLISLGLTYWTLLSDYMIYLLISWSLLGVLLYLMVGLSGKQAKETAKKTFIMVGGSDIFMILGMVILFQLTKQTYLSQAKIVLDTPLAVLSFTLMFIGAFAKAGVFPLHSWLPDACQHSFVPVTAFLPLSLDKILAVYLMIRLIGGVATLPLIAVLILMSLGCICIFVGVLMALVQHDLKRLLGYHTVSQVGYIVLGLGTGTPMGLVGAMYHMLNNIVYKTALFLSAGLIEKKCKTTYLDKLGGLYRLLPVTFVVMLISSLAISGIYPFSGYFSKHVILHGIIYTHKLYHFNGWQIFWLLGSIGGLLTLTSFVKVMYALFIEPACSLWDNVNEKKTLMLIPMILLAILCLFLGFTSETYTFHNFLQPITQKDVHIYFSKSEGLIYLLIYLTFAFILIQSLRKHAKTCNTVGIHLFDKLRNCKGIKCAYDWSESRYLDLYDIGRKGIAGTSSILRSFHTGILPTYVFWFLIGALVFAMYYFKVF